MPSRTYISKERTAPGHKVSKESLTSLLGSNASGDFKLKPLLVYLAETSRALERLFKPQFPVIRKPNKKAWVTAAIFEEWFNDHFMQAAKRYLEEKGLEFKVQLVLDNGPSHPADLGSLPSTKHDIASTPTDQGVIASFKAYYTRRILCPVLRVTENSSG
ncbi:tigger transposable element-derived protein 1-like [Macrobrachium rosenbergii]|uniref:tigger transposable element-derived protein 1-like n=1 Tax=Macrobrachium rosenbergii TaxID=79674 RepID=UPI0034D72E72